MLINYMKLYETKYNYIYITNITMYNYMYNYI